jgi:geranylgeranyl transferase type-2 subunit alpha
VQAFVADCGDQSSWIYYRWLLGNSLAHVDQATARVDRLQTQAARGECAAAGTGAADAAASLPAAVAALEEARLVLGEVLSREVGRFAEHLELDSEAKWPLLMTARLKEAQARLGLHSSDGASEGHDALRKQAAALYRKLAVVDPMRAGYYNDAAEGRAYVVVQALGTV